MYVAYNTAHASGTALSVATQYAAGVKVALQIGIPSGQFINLVGYGYSFDEDPTAAVAANASPIEIASTATASTVTTAHSTTTVKPWNDSLGRASTMTMSTTGTGYGTGALTTNTTLRYADKRFLSPTGSFDILWPSDMRPQFGAAAAAEFVQMRINTTITVNMHAYIIWEEL
jgi:hypothetical protein